MRILDFWDKISWSLADKSLYVIYGLVQIVQMYMLTPSEFGLFALLISIHTWIFVVTDAVALQNIIQFGSNRENAPKANYYSLLLHLCIVLILPLILLAFRHPVAVLFRVPELNYIFSILPIFCLVTSVRTYCIKFEYKNVQMNYLFLTNLALFLPMIVITFVILLTDHLLNLERMVWMYLFGHGLSSLVAFLLTHKEISISRRGKLKLKEVLDFSVPLLLTNSLQALPKQLDSYIVSFFFGTSTTGIYYSAKTLFRVFEESLAAAQGLVYPAAVRRLEAHDSAGLKEIISKAVSFLFFSFVIIVAILECGLSNWLINTFLSAKYIAATGQFNLLCIAALGLPFYIFSNLLVAEKKTKKLFVFVFISVLCFAVSFFFIGRSGNSSLIPLAYISYNFALGITCTAFYIKNGTYRISDLFRSLGDAAHVFAKLKAKYSGR